MEHMVKIAKAIALETAFTTSFVTQRTDHAEAVSLDIKEKYATPVSTV